MRKIASIFISLLVLLFIAFSFVSVKADGGTVSTIDGAQIRTSGTQGLKFSGEVSGSFTGGTINYGFLLSRGEYTKEQMVTMYGEGKAVFRGVGDELDGNNRFHLAIINIPASSYEADITVLACVMVDGTPTYSSASTTRNIKEVAEVAVADPNYVSNDFIENIVSANVSTFNFNGGEFTPAVDATVGRYRGGADGMSGLTLAPAGEAYSNSNWSRVFLKRTKLNSNLYSVVLHLYGDGATTNASVTADYDYILAGHANTAGAYAMATSIGSHSYVYISSLATGATIKAADNYDILLSSNFAIKDGETLPAARKSYYDFGGWYDNSSFTGSAITEKDGNDSETFYAKFTPTNYTLSYDLQGGKCNGETSKDDVIFTYESTDISLPDAGLMTKTDYTFVKWNTRSDGSGETLTTIPAGSHGNITVYAIWEYDSPIEVSLSAKQIEIITATNPTKFVKSDFSAGRFTINGVTYRVGEGELFTSIASATASASANDVIYVFAGTYSEESITFEDAGLKIIGPNYGNHANMASPSRETEAIISAAKITATKSFTIDGMKFTGNSAITSSAINGIDIRNCYFGTGGQKLYSNSEVLYFSSCQSVNLEYNYMTFSGIRPIRCENTITNTRICYNYIKSTANVMDVVRFYTIAGLFDFSNNYTEGKCSEWLIYNTNTCAGSTIVVNDNEFKGLDTTNYAGISFIGANDSTYISIVGNTFNSIAGTLIKVAGSTNKPYVTLNYNKFLVTQAKINITASNDNIVQGKNYAALGYNSTGTVTLSNTGDFASSTALDNEYYLSRYANLTSSKYLPIDENYQINIADCDGMSKSYESSNTSVATVSSTGLITPASVGSTTITINIGTMTPISFTLYVTSIIYVDRDTASVDETHVKTIADALGICTTGQKIVVAAGTYGEALSIGVDYITIAGPNDGTPGSSSRASEAIITGDITLAKGLAGLSIRGFSFTGTAKIINTIGDAGTAPSPKTNINGFNFSYNKVVSSLNSGNGFIYFVEAGSSYSHDIVLKYNYFEETVSGMTAMIYLDNLYNLDVQYNAFENINGDAIHVNDTSKGASGQKVIVSNNSFTTISNNAVHLNWISYLPVASSTAVVEVNSNTFSNVTGVGIYIGKCNNVDIAYEHVQANDNTFSNTIGTPIHIRRAPVANKFFATGNTFNSVPTSTYYVVNEMTGTPNCYIIATGNTYATTPTDANFSGSVTH